MHPTPRLPDHELLQPLGGGPMTAVYAARQRDTDAACVVKVLRPDWPDPTTAIKLLQREARALFAARHPHLVRLVHAHVTCPPYYLVLEEVPGESLRRRLRRDFRLDLAVALWIARQTAQALAALHRVGFVHGDVKPENLLLGRPGSAVLIDLGFAHRPGENAAWFREGYVLGTADYLAPELCGEEAEDGRAADLFSLGVTLFEMLTGRLPYPRGPLGKTLVRHSCDPPADIRDHAADLPPALVRLVQRLLARKPADRPRATAAVQQLVDLEIATLGRPRACA